MIHVLKRFTEEIFRVSNKTDMLDKFILLCLLWGSFGREILPPRWNAFSVGKKVFTDLPRTETDALAEGFIKVSEGEESPNFRGKQYIKDNDAIIILLFDKNGFIAGLQAGIPKGLPNNYPSNEIQPPFVEDGELYKVTVYFIDPLLICKRGRSKEQFRLQGTGTDLFIQNGTNPEQDLIEIAQNESATTWIKGKCKAMMGYHYFWNVSPDMPCENFLPVYLLYLEGNLKGFVWSFNAVLNSTTVPYERPKLDNIGTILDAKHVPICMKMIQRSTLHVFLEDKPESYICTHETSKGYSSFSTALLLFVALRW